MEQAGIQLLYGGHSRCTSAWTMPRGILSDSNRLYFVRSGSGAVHIDGRRYPLAAGKGYFIPAGRVVRNECPGRMHVDWLHFLPSDPRTEMLLSRIDGVVTLTASMNSRWREIYSGLADFFASPRPAARWRVLAMVGDVIGWLLLHRIPSIERGAVDAMLSRFGDAVSHMDRHYMRNPLLKEVAAVVHLSPIYFHRRFTQLFGLSPHAYMNRKRMLLARQMLRETDLPSSQVGRQVGYENPYYFSRAYKRHFQVSPSEERRREAKP